jgi:hypothetical protein
VADPRLDLAGNPQAAVSILTTEHFTLQGARSSAIAEANGRAGSFLAIVSSGLIALGFVAQGDTLGPLRVFALVLFPVLIFLGLTTYARTLQVSIEDVVLLQRINRLRRFYVEAVPEVARWLAPPSSDDTAGSVLRASYMRSRMHWQLLLTVPGAVGVLNSVLLAAWAGFAASFLGSWAVAPAAAVVFAAGLVGHQVHQLRQRQAANPMLAPEEEALEGGR